MMDLEQFSKIEDGAIFASGELPDEPGGLNMTNSGKMLRWIAKKGYGNDWAIYCYWNTVSDETITAHGQKVSNNEHIQKCVPCTIEMMKRYRQ